MSVRTRIKEVDERLGSPLTRAVRQGRERGVVARGEDALGRASFERDRLRRRLRHRELYSPSAADAAVVAALERDGYAVIRDALDRDELERVRVEFESYLDAGGPFDSPPNDAARSAGERGNTNAFLTPEEMAKGQGHFRHLTNRVTLTDPMITCPRVIPMVFDERVYRVASAYLRTVPAVGSVTLRKSFANDLPSFDTLLFHIDPNSPKIFKSFIYLHDVEPGGGAFSYVRGSHRKRFEGAHRNKRWQPEEIAEVYGESQIVELTARKGDVVVADTTGFHRGTKPVVADRSMITVGWVVAPEFGGKHPRNRISSGDHARLTGDARAMGELLDPR